LTARFAYNGDGVRTSKTVSGDTAQYALDPPATLPAVISDTEAVYLYGLGSVRQVSPPPPVLPPLVLLAAEPKHPE
jgi:hypothetical protein